MATEEHKKLTQFLKEVHSNLRKASKKMNPKEVWLNHCENKPLLKKYAQCMEKLATIHWAENCASETSAAISRIQWAADFCYDYFINKKFLHHQKREDDVAKKINIEIHKEEAYILPLKLIDVGSCYNPFRIYDFFEVTAVDLYPANELVLECDILNVPTGPFARISSSRVEQLQINYYDVVTFCFLLEYIPTSELRIYACEKAYSILKPGGILTISTPDSKHVGANSKVMKNWQFTLANIGFTRIKYEKLKHMHCMAFRKALCKDTAVRWAKLHQKDYMELALNIPQDFTLDPEDNQNHNIIKIKASPEDFTELPFINDL